MRDLSLMLGFLFIVLVSATAQINEDDIKLDDVLLNAQLKLLVDDRDGAMQVYENYLEENELGVLYYKMAQLSEAGGELDLALEYIDEALELESKNLYYTLFRAELLASRGETRRALEQWREMSKLMPDDPKYRQKVIDLSIELGETGEALEQINFLQDKYGLRPELAMQKVSVLMEESKVEEALDALSEAERSYPSNADLLAVKCRLLIENGDYKRAQIAYRSLLEVDRKHPSIALLSNRLVESSTDLEIDFYDKISDPTFSVTDKVGWLIPYIKKYAESGDSALGNELLNIGSTMLELYPQNGKVQALNGDIYFLSGQKTKATSFFKEAVKSEKSNFMVWQQLIDNLMEAGDHKDVTLYAEEALTYFPNALKFKYQKAFADYRLGKLAEARRGLQKITLLTEEGDDLYELAQELINEIQ